jgi:hypothetical protein
MPLTQPFNKNNMNLNNDPLVRSLGSQDAELVKEVNKSNQYEWMKNKYGVLVPIALHLVNDKLQKGFIRTDGVVHTDDLSERVKAPIQETNPATAMAKIAEQMAESSKVQAEVVKELVRGRRKKVADEE